MPYALFLQGIPVGLIPLFRASFGSVLEFIMAKSRAARRRRSQQMTVPYARMSPDVNNWVVGGSCTDSTGAVIGGPPPTGPSTWNMGTVSTALASGSPISFQAVTIVAAPNTSTPTIGRMKIQAIKGHVEASRPVNAGRVSVAVCIYVSEFNSGTGKWDVRDPLVTADAARDDYFYLEAWEAGLPALGAETAPETLRFDLSLVNPLIIGGGQALHVTVSYFNSAGGNISLASMFRTRVGPVA